MNNFTKSFKENFKKMNVSKMIGKDVILSVITYTTTSAIIALVKTVKEAEK